ncbi:MAG: carbohydrate-binding domain-containing protein [Candidatus Cryptobacteroides sp.]
MKRLVLSIFVASLALCACDKATIITPQEVENGEQGQDDPEDQDQDESDPSGTGNDDITNISGSEEAELDESEFSKVIDLLWQDGSVQVNNGSSLEVSCDGAHVTVGKAGAAGEKVRINLKGASADGSLKIYNGLKEDDTNKKLLLSFEGVELASSRGPAVNIQSGKTVYVLLAEGSENTLRDCASYSGIPEGEDAKACFFSEKQLVFSGKGSLKVQGLCKHGICVDDYICIQGGNLEIEAVKDGIHLNDYLRMEGGKVNIVSSSEGIQCEEAEQGYFYICGGSLTIRTSDEKSGGIETASDIVIAGGNLDISVSGNAAKCLKSDNNISIEAGTVELLTTGSGMYDSTDKEAKAAACIKAENIVNISGGNISCRSTGNGGKGINCFRFVCDDAQLSVTTSGSSYKYSTQTCRPKAIKATDGLTINGGDIVIRTSGTEGEGLESKSWVEINGGRIDIEAKDDGINAATTVTFNGGYTYVVSTAGDGIDSNYNKAGSIVFNNGVVISHAAGGAEEGFDADSHANLSFNGGYAFCTGGQMGGNGGGRGGWGGGGGGNSSASPSCSQSCFQLSGSLQSGWFTICDTSNNVVMSCYIPRSLSNCSCLFSAPLNSGQSYKYGVLSSAPQGAEEVFGNYFFADGNASGLSSSFTAGSGFSTL